MAAQTSSPKTSVMLAHRNWRTDWTAERTCLYWYLTFEDQPALTSLFHEVEDDLRRVESVDVVPPSWLHLTLVEVGWADDVSAAEMADLVAAAKASVALLPLHLELGPITTMTDAVVLEVHATDEVMALQAGLADGLRATRAAAPEPDEFWPHISLAYTNRDCARDEVMSSLADVAGRTTRLTVPRLTLVAVTRHEDHYRWQAVAAVAADDEESAAS